jgi:GT2 family glycosyltransferase
MTVSVVVLNWNGLDLIGQCLDALLAQSYKKFEIIVVENGSTDGSVEFLKKHYPQIRLLLQPKNLGFDGGVNVGIRMSDCEYIALLNNDAIAEPDWLSYLVKTLESQPKAAACTSKMLRQLPDGSAETFDSTGDYYTIWGRAETRGRDVRDTGQYDEAESVFGASGGATLFRRSAIAKVGLFDEEFFAYYEDVDWSFRARHCGYDIYYEPRAVVRHQIGATSGGGTSPFTRYHFTKNQWYVYIKNMPAPLFWRYLPRFVALQILFYCNSFRKGLGWATTKGYGRTIVTLPQMLAKRRQILRSSVLSVRQIDKLLLRTLPPGTAAGLLRMFGKKSA